MIGSNPKKIKNHLDLWGEGSSPNQSITLTRPLDQGGFFIKGLDNLELCNSLISLRNYNLSYFLYYTFIFSLFFLMILIGYEKSYFPLKISLKLENYSQSFSLMILIGYEKSYFIFIFFLLFFFLKIIISLKDRRR